jgi:epoxyqueuosine reductase
MAPAERTRWICKRARTAGFDLCGVAPAHAFDELAHLPEWLARGYAGEMNYLHDPRRADPRLVVESARSLIVVALNYNSPQPYWTESPQTADDERPRGWISRYAWGDDYHRIVQQMLETLVAEMRAHFAESFEARAYVDTGPVVERIAAKYAGLGWLAKNTCLINEELGSWLFLGVVVTTLELEPTLGPNEAPPADRCGNCTLCLDACPTHAFAAPGQLDARRCISYLTIELRGAIPEDLRRGMGRAVVGCDICQEVCPWNRQAPVTQIAAFQPRHGSDTRNSKNENRNSGVKRDELRASSHDFRLSLFAPPLEWLAALSQREFGELFHDSAVKRAKWRGVVRNACVALGNSCPPRDSALYSRVVCLLENLASTGDDLIAEHACWALERLRAAHFQWNVSRQS